MWIYPVDMKRTNEFGQVFEKEKDYQDEDYKKIEIENEEVAVDASKVKRRGIKKTENQN